jgi:curved DNA-binding protein CbpA
MKRKFMLNRNDNYFVILEIQPTNDLDLIRKAYKRLALKYHPDKGGDIEDFKLLASILTQLSDDNYRELYYQSIKHNKNPRPYAVGGISTQEAYQLFNNLIAKMDRMIEITEKMTSDLKDMSRDVSEKLDKILELLNERAQSPTYEQSDKHVLFKKNTKKRKADNELVSEVKPSKNAKHYIT